ncbi:MAG: hypothetical protein NC820_07035 [Candidatus Omnitrophica bacterium]|nr:hypothetical protein [Candidatus Omnitrophota bacterium]
MTNLIDLRNRVRVGIDDTSISHLIRNEIPEGIIDGENKRFLLKYYPIVEGSVYVIVDGVPLTPDEYIVDLVKGVIVFNVPPVTSVVVDYYFNFFTDDSIDVWIGEGLLETGKTSLSDLPVQLETAVVLFAMSHCCKAMARKYAEGFSWSIGPESVNKDTISSKYRELSEICYNRAVQQRDNFYKRYGARESPEFSIKTQDIQRFDVVR